MQITVEIENVYVDGHQSTHEVVVEADDTLQPDSEELEEWFSEKVFEHTGDGHGVNVEACYFAKIIAADNPALVGEEYEWC